LASWTDAAHALPVPQPQRRRRSAPKRKPQARRGVAGGAAWIVLVAVLLAGVVAINVAVLRLNVQLDKLNVERTRLRGEKQAIASQLSLAAASPRIQGLARRQGLVPADPTQTTYVRLRPGSR
jgi:cell division septal protein FtsQ